MLPRADSIGTRPIAVVEAPTPVGSATDARQEVYHRLAQLTVGDQLQTKILSRLEDGTFIVGIADTAARMSLPVGTKVGDTLQMTLVDTEPRPTFLVGTEAAADTGSTPATLSSAARMIDKLLQTAQQTGTATTVVGKTPLVPSASTGPVQMATALHDALGASGLFYESHVGEWAEGSRTLAALIREPQAQAGIRESAQLRTLLQTWTDSGRTLPNLVKDLQNRIDSPAAAQTVAAPAGAPASLQNFIQQWTDSGRSLTDLTHAIQTQLGAEHVPQPDTLNAQSAQLINLQLDTLENQRVRWHGELWPGQTLDWEVSKDAPDSQASAQAQQQSWHSVVRFELPTLGTVSATIHLVGERVNMFVRTDTEGVATRLRAHGKELADALKTAGSPLDSLVVKQDAKT